MSGILAGVLVNSSATPGTFDYGTAGTGTLIIPAGYTTCTLQVWGGGGGGGRGGAFGAFGGGGGAGGYSKSSLTVTGAGGQTILYTVGAGGIANGGAGGLSNAYAGTFTMTAMTGNGGNGGTPGVDGTGGTATGGTVTNTTGASGSTGGGGGGTAGDGGLTAGAGGDGGDGAEVGPPYMPATNGLPGDVGRVRFVFS